MVDVGVVVEGAAFFNIRFFFLVLGLADCGDSIKEGGGKKACLRSNGQALCNSTPSV